MSTSITIGLGKRYWKEESKWSLCLQRRMWRMDSPNLCKRRLSSRFEKRSVSSIYLPDSAMTFPCKAVNMVKEVTRQALGKHHEGRKLIDGPRSSHTLCPRGASRSHNFAPIPYNAPETPPNSPPAEAGGPPGDAESPPSGGGGGGPSPSSSRC